MKAASILSVVALIVGCGHSATAEAAEADGGTAALPPRCKAPQGSYEFAAVLSDIADDARCQKPGSIASVVISMTFLPGGRLKTPRAESGTVCSSSFDSRRCEVRTTCALFAPDGSVREEGVFKVAPSGQVTLDLYTQRGTGAYCPHLTFKGAATPAQK